MLLAMDTPQTAVLLAGIVILIVVMLRYNRKRLSQGPRPLRDDEDTRTSTRSAQQVREQLDDVMVQLEELARQTNAQIDNRATRLEILLAEADEKIGTLRTLVERLEASPAPRDEPPGPDDAPNPEHVRVYELADGGKSPVEIARELERDVGEVELILALRRK